MDTWIPGWILIYHVFGMTTQVENQNFYEKNGWFLKLSTNNS